MTRQYTSKTMIKFFHNMKFEEQEKFLFEINATPDDPEDSKY